MVENGDEAGGRWGDVWICGEAEIPEPETIQAAGRTTAAHVRNREAAAGGQDAVEPSWRLICRDPGLRSGGGKSRNGPGSVGVLGEAAQGHAGSVRRRATVHEEHASAAGWVVS